MDDISQLCNERVANLASEEGGKALFAFHAPPNEAAGVRQILRQDHPEVLDSAEDLEKLLFDLDLVHTHNLGIPATILIAYPPSSQ